VAFGATLHIELCVVPGPSSEAGKSQK